MAISEKELQISNKSYTNKDFESIYYELLDKAQQLSDRYSPKDANESDPFIILLKLAAFVSDKINYNIDKNILERFILSCTQETSMRELTSRLGYNMHYYKSAEVSVLFKYKYLQDYPGNPIVIPQYSDLTTFDNNIHYITLNQTTIDINTGESLPVDAIQGKLQTLTVLGNSVITLDNISDNKLYFPEHYVAENGVFISNSSKNSNSDIWQSVSNLNTVTYGSSVFKFSFDSVRNLPYIEFPEWLNEIINDGLIIKYVVTDGIRGNITARSLNRVSVSNLSVDIDSSNITVINSSASISGADPETIDESYAGFKKIIGTFDTLVTCRDYANAIFNLLDGLGNPFVSNVQVSDRRTDINNACDVVTYTDVGVQTISMPLRTGDVDNMSAYDLCIYASNPVNNLNLASIDKQGGYNKGFDKVDDPYLKLNIEQNENIDRLKTIAHTYKHLDGNDIFQIRDYNILNAIITTNSKVNSIEQSEIKLNISNALLNKYNSRELTFGDAIAYDELLDVIENADPRIKSISLEEPDHEIKIVTADNNEISLYNSGTPTNQFKFIISKNILSGRVALFEYDDEFDYSYKYSAMQKYNTIKSFTSVCNINGNHEIPEGSDYILLPNENVEFIAPSLKVVAEYPYGIDYYLVLDGKNSIPADSYYQLKSGEELIFKWTDSSDVSQKREYEEDVIIYTVNELYTTASRIADHQSSRFTDNDGKQYFTLGTNDKVQYCNINEDILSTTKKCYWITRSEDNKINWTPTGQNIGTYILGPDEYFFYTDMNLTELFIYTTGTTLSCTDTTIYGGENGWTNSSDINIEKITEDGLDALSDYFKPISFTSNAKLTLTQNDIITLTEGYTIYNNDDTSFLQIPDNAFGSDIDVKISYSYNGIDTNLPDRSDLYNCAWKCRSILDINASKNDGQLLQGNQEIKFKYPDTTTAVTLSNGDNFKFNIDVNINGGQDISLEYIDSQTAKETYPDMLVYSVDNNILSNVSKDTNNMYQLKMTSDTHLYKLYVASDINGNSNDRYFMLYIPNGSLGDSRTITITSYHSVDPNVPVACLYQVNIIPSPSDPPPAPSTTLTFSNDGLYIVQIKDYTDTDNNTDIRCDNITIESNSSQTIICMLSELKYVTGLNNYLNINTLDVDDMIEYLRREFNTQFVKFNMLADLDPSKEIELSSDYKMDSAQAFYDSNNIANKWVIPKIDFENSNIKIARGSIK